MEIVKGSEFMIIEIKKVALWLTCNLNFMQQARRLKQKNQVLLRK